MQYIMFEAAGLKLAVAASLVGAVHETMTVQPIAGTCHWFSGLAVVNGKLLPVTDLGAFAGRQYCSGHLLELAATTGIVGLRIDTVSGMIDSKTANRGAQRHQSEPMASQIPLSGEVLSMDGERHHVLDVTALVESPAFVNIID